MATGSWHGGDGPPALELRGIVKRFPGVVANDRVDLAVERGEIRALLGENGAGKTTLMRILYGLYAPDEGEIYLGGQPQRFRSPTDAIQAGLGMVHQHFMLFPSLSVAENVVFGHEPKRWGLVDRRAAELRVAELGERFGLQIDPAATVDDLPVGARQRVEILKTLYRNAKVLILDEPTAVLTPRERQGLFRILRQLADEGRTVVFITHKLQEVMELAERATVLRDGRVTATVEVASTSPEELCRHMVGRDVMLRPERSAPKTGEAVLSVERLRVKGTAGRPRLDDITFDIRAGEIVGVAGVAGNGQSELVAALSGLQPATTGQVLLRGQDVTRGSIAERRRAGLAYIPEDTGGVGLALSAAVADNLLMSWRDDAELTRRGVISRSGARALAARLVERFGVKISSAAEAAGNLSGGNRQKIVVARELSRQPTLLIAEQPTQGVDVGAAEGLHRELLAVRQRGGAVLLISAELGELIALADSILVMFEGRIVGELPGPSADEETLGLLAAGGEAA